MEFPGHDNLTCHQAQLKMSLYIENDPCLAGEERKAFEAHLKNCPDCARDYEESKFVICLVKRYWRVSEDTLALIEKANQLTKPQMTIEEGWEDLKRRIPELARFENRRKRFRLFRRVGAVAACLAIGISILLAFSYSKQEIAQKPVAEQITSIPKPSIKIVLVSEKGNVFIPAGHEITTADELKTLLINNKHQMVMNTNTALLIEPLVKNNQIGCMVKLTSGEILADIEHDGNPFVVDTAHCKAIITGTTFDVKAIDAATTLVVTEGIVRFESQEGLVEVAAGQISKVEGKSAPTEPVSCNTTKLIAWATGHEFENLSAGFRPATETYDITDHPLFVTPEPIDLESINYEQWIEQKREWFKQQFPWIFQLKDALAKEGIKVDYPQLLIQSGDVWQFVCLETEPVRFSAPTFDSLLKTASSYGFNKQWLLENIPISQFILEKPILSQGTPTGLKAFERWLRYADSKEQPPTPLYSFCASKYLAETRSLIWFAIRDGKYNLANEKHIEVLALLQEEVKVVNKFRNEVLYLQDNSKLSCEDKCQEQVNNIGMISLIADYEKTLVEYVSISFLQ
jgi:hypothetical protein